MTKDNSFFDFEKLKGCSEITILGLDFLDNAEYEKLKSVLVDLFVININMKLNIFYFPESSEFITKILEKDNRIVNDFQRNRQTRELVIGTTNQKINGFIDILCRKCEEEYKNALKYGKAKTIPENISNTVKENILIGQINLPQAYSAIRFDNEIWWAPKILDIPNINSYVPLEADSNLYQQVDRYLKEIKPGGRLGKFVSKVGAELIGAYVKSKNTGGYEHVYQYSVFPRSAFENELRFKRYSVWMFIFNRKGELLLHQRSHIAKDNCLLWDKSAGGHFNLEDSSTEITAKKEILEELFLEKAEFGEYSAAELSKVLPFGAWKPDVRSPESFKYAFDGLPNDNLILFRGYKNNQPWTEGDNPSTRRKSKIQLTNPLEFTTIKRGKYEIQVPKAEVIDLSPIQTWFVSDVYFCITPEGVIDTEEQMYDKLHRVYAEGAAYNHKIISVFDLKEWIEKEKRNGTAEKTFTWDLLYFMDRYTEQLDEFSQFVKTTFERN